ncbi:(3R)-3-hydroxyacyl-CoA dehydrogenase-like isoform X2 [Macrobrachium rosenbergii]|uniref:(3R)-3-hydroxyacyl-CoA dehydrogenase-like isoform X2 n=1 Tax=Macrobrachium rosenbergii TaxID=79674 RepID=UPI0034D62D21
MSRKRCLVSSIKKLVDAKEILLSFLSALSLHYTGGGSGIGRATCRILEREGATVVVCDIKESTAMETVNLFTDPSKHLALMTDVSKADSVDATISAVVAKYKSPPTLLVNSAGVAGIGPVKSLKEETFKNCIDVNLKGTYLMCKAVANAMEKHGLKSGSFVNIASITGILGLKDNSCYSSSKGGVIAFTRAVSKELIHDGIRVNSILPGPIETGMVSSDVEIVQRAIRERTPIGRIGQPEEVGEVAAFLLSDRSSYMVGAAVEVTGGYVC